MTEYWVSQGNKWCDFCKIYIANNPLSIRTHELGQRHKDNVAKRLASMRKENAAKEKEQKEAARALEQIEAKAKRSYQKDIASFQEVRALNVDRLGAYEDCPETSKSSAVSEDAGWEYDDATGYYYNQVNGYYHDPNSGFYYSNTLGKWVTREEAFPTSHVSSESKQDGPIVKKPVSASEGGFVTGDKVATKRQSGPPPGVVFPSSLNPMRSVKGVPSSVAVNKRKREGEKQKVVSKEEAAALKAREAAKKRMEEREKPLLGLYRSY